MAPAEPPRSAASTIDGNWIRLVPVAAYPDEAIEDLRFRLGLRPEMAAPGVDGRPAGSSRFGEAAVIADEWTGDLLGVIGNVEIGNFPGVAGLVIYVDEERTRAGYAMEAWWRYVERIFALGATKVQMEVLEFNTPVHRIMRRIGARPEAVMRQHFYIAGRHWDGTLYAFDRPAWEAVDRRYREKVMRPVALRSSRQREDLLQPRREAPALKVDYLLFADAAIAADGKHYLHGAGWDSIVAPMFPVFHRHMSAALRLRLRPGTPTERLAVDVVDPTGASLLAAPNYTDVRPNEVSADGSDQVICLVFGFDSLHFTSAGEYAAVVSAGGIEVHRESFHVRLAVPAG